MSRYGYSKDLAEQGVRVEFDDGVGIVAHPSFTFEFQDRLAARAKPHQRMLRRGGEIALRKMRELKAEVLYEIGVSGWFGITDEDGRELPYTRENFLSKYLSDPIFHEDVNDSCDTPETFRMEDLAESIEEQSGNSRAPSSGGSATERTSSSSSPSA